jgi:hypothetical protein
MTKHPLLDFQQAQDNFFFFTASRPVLGPTQQWGRKFAYIFTLEPPKNIFTDRRKVVNLCIGTQMASRTVFRIH